MVNWRTLTDETQLRAEILVRSEARWKEEGILIENREE